tara:strand:- start:5914 stop:7662 length:1749 start_codon:yes stop_codon:yes gene_type:complete
MKASLVLANWLKSIGVKNIFGVTGGSVVHLLHGAEAVGINVIYTHHEQAASFAAEAASRTSEKISVCMVTTGPGGTNAITGLASAWLDSISCLFISGQARSEDTRALKYVRQSGSQHLDIISVVKPLTKATYQLENDPNELQKILEGIQKDLFSGRPGPVWLDIPLEFQWADIKGKVPPLFIKKQSKKSIPDTLYDAIKFSKRPVFVLGYGCRLSSINQLLIDYCHQNKIPYVLTWNTLDFSAYSNEENCGLIGISGTRDANLVINYSDLVVGFGTHLSKMLTGDKLEDFAPDAKNIFILDLDKSEFLRFNSDERFKCINFDLKNLDIASLPSKDSTLTNWVDLYKNLKNLRTFGIIEECNKKIPKNSINQYVIYQLISENLNNEDVIVVDGGGNVLFSALQSLILKNKNRLITGAGIGCMGSGLPEAIGAAASSNEKVICFIGDGSFQFNIQELQTIVHHNLNIVIILFNNDGYLAIKNTQDSFFDRRFGVDKESGLSLPNFKKIILAYGLKYKSFESVHSLKDFTKYFQNAKGPSVIEIKISDLTPLLPRGGFKKDKNGNNIRRKTWDLIPPIEKLPPRS